MKKIAIVITPMCQQTKSLYGIRIERRGDIWFKTWSFPMKQDVAERENFQAEMDLSNMEDDPAYPGCPHCKSTSLIQCSFCRRIYCYEGETESTCPWCGTKGLVTNGGWDSVSGGGY